MLFSKKLVEAEYLLLFSKKSGQKIAQFARLIDPACFICSAGQTRRLAITERVTEHRIIFDGIVS